MQSQFHERIANIVLITKKLCERLSPMNQYVLVLRSIEHVERVMLLEKHGGLPCQLPQETLLIDVAVVMVRRPWCYSVLRPWGNFVRVTRVYLAAVDLQVLLWRRAV